MIMPCSSAHNEGKPCIPVASSRHWPGLLSALALGQVANADILISVDKSTQRMTVMVDGQPRYNWPVSTGRPGYDTPSGTFRAFRMDRNHRSEEYDNAPMPYSIFFTASGIAVHGTDPPRRSATRPRTAACAFR